MVVIEVDRKALSMRGRGHARGLKTPEGHDLICCMVSTLMQSYDYAGRMTGNIMTSFRDGGYFETSVDPDTTPRGCLPAAFDGFVLGLRMIAENYPDHVRLVEVGGGL